MSKRKANADAAVSNAAPAAAAAASTADAESKSKRPVPVSEAKPVVAMVSGGKRKAAASDPPHSRPNVKECTCLPPDDSAGKRTDGDDDAMRIPRDGGSRDATTKAVPNYVLHSASCGAS